MSETVTATMVFEIEKTKFRSMNPFKTETPWGIPCAVGIGNILDEADELRECVNGLPEAIAALMDIRARARFELDNPTELRDTAFSLIEKAADAALAKLKAEP